MKQAIIIFLFFIVSISPNFAQNTDLNVFKIAKSEISVSGSSGKSVKFRSLLKMGS